MKMWTALFMAMTVLVAQAHAAALPEETSVSKDLESSVPKDLESVVSVLLLIRPIAIPLLFFNTL